MPELRDIFKRVRLKSMSPAQAKAFNQIRVCRTSTLGYHSEVCTECGSVDVSYNSCRNRHCPKCQQSAQQEWIEAHPHVHCIVPGGGLSNDGLRFVRSRKKFFIPVKVISKKFRGKFLETSSQN